MPPTFTSTIQADLPPQSQTRYFQLSTQSVQTQTQYIVLQSCSSSIFLSPSLEVILPFSLVSYIQ